MCQAFVMVYPKVELSGGYSDYGLLDLANFFYQAAIYGYYFNYTTIEGGIQGDGIYDVSVPGAEQFYHDFVTGNITGNFDEIDELPLSDPQIRGQNCYDMQRDPLDGDGEEIVALQASVDYEEYDMDDFYVCANAN